MPVVVARWRGLPLGIAVLAAALLVALVQTVFAAPMTEALEFAVPVALATSPISFSAAFLCRALPFSRTPVERLAGAALAAAIVSGAIWAGVGYAWWDLLRRYGMAIVEPPVPVLTTVLGALGGLMYLLSVTGNYLWQTFEESAEASRRGLASEVAHRDAELRALRAQVDPHFLFNSLNSIAALTTADPERARQMCQLLADFLRESLAVGGTARIPLGREVALAEQYLRIEQVRFGRRLAVRASVASDVAELPVPPLILQPLVENAVRHGIATLVDGGTIEIAAWRSGRRATVEISNPRDEDGGRPGTGRGLDLVRRRLEAMFGEGSGLAIEATPQTYRVLVAVPVGEEAR